METVVAVNTSGASCVDVAEVANTLGASPPKPPRSFGAGIMLGFEVAGWVPGLASVVVAKSSRSACNAGAADVKGLPVVVDGDTYGGGGSVAALE